MAENSESQSLAPSDEAEVVGLLPWSAKALGMNHISQGHSEVIEKNNKTSKLGRKSVLGRIPEKCR